MNNKVIIFLVSLFILSYGVSALEWNNINSLNSFGLNSTFSQYASLLGNNIFTNGGLAVYNTSTLGTTPYLNISSAGVKTPFVFVNGAGKMGIGTDNPTYALYVNGSYPQFGIDGSGSGAIMAFNNNGVINGEIGHFGTVNALQLSGGNGLAAGNVGMSIFPSPIRVGINTSSNTPTAVLEINSGVGVLALNVSGNLFVNSTNVGIGTSTPIYKLEVAGTFKAGTTDGFVIGNVAGVNRIQVTGTTFNLMNSGDGYANTNMGSGYFSGTVGIGTNAQPQQMLIVTGATGVNITNTGAVNSLLVNDVAGDTTPFVIDQNGLVGIGANTPKGLLDIYNTSAITNNVYLNISSAGVGAPHLFVSGGGNVGMGTVSSEAYRLYISGNTYSGGAMFFAGSGLVSYGGLGTTGGSAFVLRGQGATSLSLGAGGASDLMIINSSSGNVGINNVYPAQKLSVVGTANITGGAGLQGLFVDSTGKVGIGTASPSALLTTKSQPTGWAMNVSGQLYVNATGTYLQNTGGAGSTLCVDVTGLIYRSALACA